MDRRNFIHYLAALSLWMLSGCQRPAPTRPPISTWIPPATAPPPTPQATSRRVYSDLETFLYYGNGTRKFHRDMQNAGVDVSQQGMYSHEELAPILNKWIRHIDLEIPGFIPYPMLTDFDISGEMTIQHSRPSQLTSRYLLDKTTLPYRNLDIVQAQAMTTYQQIEYMTIIQLGYAFEKHGLQMTFVYRSGDNIILSESSNPEGTVPLFANLHVSDTLNEQADDKTGLISSICETLEEYTPQGEEPLSSLWRTLEYVEENYLSNALSPTVGEMLFPAETIRSDMTIEEFAHYISTSFRQPAEQALEAALLVDTYVRTAGQISTGQLADELATLSTLDYAATWSDGSYRPLRNIVERRGDISKKEDRLHLAQRIVDTELMVRNGIRLAAEAYDLLLPPVAEEDLQPNKDALAQYTPRGAIKGHTKKYALRELLTGQI